MRCWVSFLFISFIINVSALAQGEGWGKPRIVGQKPVSTNEDQSVELKLNDLEVRDRDDWFYPYGFSLRVYEGSNYTFNGSTIVPVANFNGILSVPVTVNDGDQDSERFNVQIEIKSVNDPPSITGQQNVSTNEDQGIVLSPTNLIVSDADDNQFTLLISEGPNYTVSGLTITPVQNFSGMLQIPVRVSDGKDLSAVYALQLAVTPINDPPKITGQVSVEVEKNKSVTLQLSYLTVIDPDNTFPTGFSLSVIPSSDNSYSTSGNQITPALNFEGMLSVGVTVSDGGANSEIFQLQVKVTPAKNGPTITGQSSISIDEDQPVTIQFTHLRVSDPDSSYPNGFTLRILPGSNYTTTGNVVMPVADYNGNLSVNVTVNDGATESNVYGLVIGVRPINDAPRISNFETTPLIYRHDKGSVFITQQIEITDADNDSVRQAEISFRPDTYRTGLDELLFTNTTRITGTFDKQRGILNLIGLAPKAEYVSALKSIKYNFTAGQNLPFEVKTFFISVSDGKIVSEKVERQIKSSDVIVDLNIPTAFTPNGDRANDTWSIKPLKPSEELANAIVRIYNKSGLLLFEAEGFDNEWDGRLNGEVLPADTYYYTIDLNLQYSRTLFKGLVTILR